MRAKVVAAAVVTTNVEVQPLVEDNATINNKVDVNDLLTTVKASWYNLCIYLELSKNSHR